MTYSSVFPQSVYAINQTKMFLKFVETHCSSHVQFRPCSRVSSGGFMFYASKFICKSMTKTIIYKWIINAHILKITLKTSNKQELPRPDVTDNNFFTCSFVFVFKHSGLIIDIIHIQIQRIRINHNCDKNCPHYFTTLFP